MKVMNLVASSTTVLALAVATLGFAQEKKAGESIFSETCAVCHGPDGKAQTDIGKGMQAADLTSAAVQQQTDTQLSDSIDKGKGKMPPFHDKLSGDDIKAVVTYIRSLGKK